MWVFTLVKIIIFFSYVNKPFMISPLVLRPIAWLMHINVFMKIICHSRVCCFVLFLSNKRLLEFWGVSETVDFVNEFLAFSWCDRSSKFCKLWSSKLFPLVSLANQEWPRSRCNSAKASHCFEPNWKHGGRWGDSRKTNASRSRRFFNSRSKIHKVGWGK